MFLLVRDDLGDVPVGKMMGQAGHAFAHALFRAPFSVSRVYDMEPEHVKIVLRCSAADMHQTELRCMAWDIPHHQQIDLGRTILKTGTPTCLAIGPIEEKDYRLLELNHFKLY